MATIRFEHKHGLTQDEAIQRVKDVVEEFSEKVKADVRWNGPNATFKGSGFSGAATVQDGRVSIDVELGLLLRPLKAKIEERINRMLREGLA